MQYLDVLGPLMEQPRLTKFRDLHFSLENYTPLGFIRCYSLLVHDLLLLPEKKVFNKEDY